jgi:hypothetical protein
LLVIVTAENNNLTETKKSLNCFFSDISAWINHVHVHGGMAEHSST